MQISFFHINSLDEAIQKLRFFRDILSPINESYWFVASGLLCLCDGQHIIGKIFEYFRLIRIYPANISRLYSVNSTVGPF